MRFVLLLASILHLISLSLSLSPSLSLSLSSYLLHSADLSFLEALSQTLTSAQVGIKSEVARSNSQARDIFQRIDKISAILKKVQAKVHAMSYIHIHMHTHSLAHKNSSYMTLVIITVHELWLSAS